MPEIITPALECKYVRVDPSVAQWTSHYYDTATFFMNMGVISIPLGGKFLIESRKVTQYFKRGNGISRLLTNSAWVWTASPSGEFDITLKGMVNRHIMTMILSNATNLAKYIDEVLVRTTEKPELFTAKAVNEYNRAR